MDFRPIIENLTWATAALGVMGAAAIYAQIRFCLWAAPKVARFFVMRRLR
jgi:hypothetical protein